MYDLKMKNYTGRMRLQFVEKTIETVDKYKSSYLYFYDLINQEDLRVRMPKSWNYGESGDEFYLLKVCDPKPRWKFERVPFELMTKRGKFLEKRKEFHKMSVEVLIQKFQSEDFREDYKDFISELAYTTRAKLRLAGIKI